VYEYTRFDPPAATVWPTSHWMVTRRRKSIGAIRPQFEHTLMQFTQVVIVHTEFAEVVAACRADSPDWDRAGRCSAQSLAPCFVCQIARVVRVTGAGDKRQRTRGFGIEIRYGRASHHITHYIRPAATKHPRRRATA